MFCSAKVVPGAGLQDTVSDSLVSASLAEGTRKNTAGSVAIIAADGQPEKTGVGGVVSTVQWKVDAGKVHRLFPCYV